MNSEDSSREERVKALGSAREITFLRRVRELKSPGGFSRVTT